jgi:hypothetical protein
VAVNIEQEGRMAQERTEEGHFSRLRRRIDDAIAAADAGFQSESDDDEPPQFWSEAAREFEATARALRELRTKLS